MLDFNPDEISRLIRHRRSIYPAQYSGKTIKKEIIEEILENANWAPTHKLSEPWRFHVFTGQGLNKLAEFMASLYKEVTDSKGSFNRAIFEKLQQKALMTSHVIAIGMKRDAKERLPEIEEIEAVASAVQNMQLTAAAYGIGCYWGTGGITYFDKAKKFFNLSSKDKLLGFLFLGYPKSNWPKSKRKPIKEKVTWIE